MEETIRTAIQEALNELGTQSRIDAYAVTFGVEWPTDPSHGDYATNVALAGAKMFNTTPQYLAGDLLPRLKQKLAGIASDVSIAGPGFINITLTPEEINKQVLAAAGNTEWGKNSSRIGERVMVEYTDPNPFKEMHIGHLMSNVIGESIVRLIEAGSATISRTNYEGDVGPHVAKAIWALQQKGDTEPTAEEIGKAYTHGSRAYEESEKAKAEIDAINVALYEGTDHELMELWRKGRERSLAAFEDIYRILGTKFDYYFFESETAPTGMSVVRDGVERGVFEESEGAIIYRGEKKGLHTLVFITSRGTPTYEAKDIGLAFLKEEHWPSDESIIITAAEQIGHFKVFLSALEEIAPELAKKTKHVPHGFLRLESGKMSSREGNVITALDLIRMTTEKTLERNDDPLIAEQVAIGAIKYSILKSNAGSDIIFDFDKSLSLEGDSGPYLQYAVVRAKSVLAQASAADEKESASPDTSYLLERLLIRFPQVVREAELQLAPHTLVHYLTQLAGEWNSFYAKERIIGGDHQAYKLELARAFVRTMETGLALLGIPAPEKM